MRRSRGLSAELLILLRSAQPIDCGVALPLTDSLSEFLAFRFRGLPQPALPAKVSYRVPSGMPMYFVQGSIPSRGLMAGS